jgi:hypothetical protein
MQSQIWGLGGQVLGWNGLPLKAPNDVFMITGGTNLIPRYTYDLGASWIPVDTTTGSYGTPLNAVYGTTGQNKHIWSYDGIHMFFTSYNTAQSKSRIWYTNDGGRTMSFYDFTTPASYNARQFGTWTEDNNKAYITGWVPEAKVNYSLNNFLSVLESSTGQADNNYPLLITGSKSGQYVYAGAGNSGGVICSSTYGASFTLKVLNTGGSPTHTNSAICCDAGQCALVFGNATFGMYMTNDYGSNWSQISVNTPVGCMFYDATLIMYATRTAITNYFYFTTNQGGSWTSIALPSGVTTGATPLVDNKNKVVYLYQYNASPATLWKLNDAKNGWDDVGTFANSIGAVGVSEIGRGIGLIDWIGHVWYSPSPANTGSWMDIATLSNVPYDGMLKFINVI